MVLFLAWSAYSNVSDALKKPSSCSWSLLHNRFFSWSRPAAIPALSPIAMRPIWSTIYCQSSHLSLNWLAWSTWSCSTTLSIFKSLFRRSQLSDWSPLSSSEYFSSCLLLSCLRWVISSNRLWFIDWLTGKNVKDGLPAASAFLELFKPPEAILAGDRADGIGALSMLIIWALGSVEPEDCLARLLECCRLLLPLARVSDPLLLLLAVAVTDDCWCVYE